MEFFINLIYGILLIGAGILIIKYRRNVKGWTGNFYWAEHYLGRGSTYFVLILIGLAFILFGILYPFGGADYFSGNYRGTELKIEK